MSSNNSDMLIDSDNGAMIARFSCFDWERLTAVRNRGLSGGWAHQANEASGVLARRAYS